MQFCQTFYSSKLVNWNRRVQRDSDPWPVYRPVKGLGPIDPFYKLNQAFYLFFCLKMNKISPWFESHLSLSTCSLFFSTHYHADEQWASTAQEEWRREDREGKDSSISFMFFLTTEVASKSLFPTSNGLLLIIMTTLQLYSLSSLIIKNSTSNNKHFLVSFAMSLVHVLQAKILYLYFLFLLSSWVKLVL
jgi:hypothetical protein